ncbi:hypothetical protein [Persicobacter diffluens]|uniref:Uncharacterized protein n=1 Tax=Persicobacter diffluens TaxID=981 RepID=A0AAN4W1X1_9BACT|nr:hypothetical protein PEDI_37630 [Persicobacter diffluens]
MKVADLRSQLKTLKQEEIVQLAVEFYKLIPKAKKEDHDLDGLIMNPKRAKTTTAKTTLSLQDMKVDIENFVDNAKNQYYLMPNRVVPKKERSTWRFKVKRWYKELLLDNRKDKDVLLQNELLVSLYNLLIAGRDYHYFSADDPFESVGIEQATFYQEIVLQLQQKLGKADAVEQSIQLIIGDRNYLYSFSTDLIDVLIRSLDIPDLKYKGIEVVESEIRKLNDKAATSTYDFSNYKFIEKNNRLAELGLRIYCDLFEFEEGIAFFKQYYLEERAGVKLCALINVLFYLGEKELILSEIELSRAKGEKPRIKVEQLYDFIKEEGHLPSYF